MIISEQYMQDYEPRLYYIGNELKVECKINNIIKNYIKYLELKSDEDIIKLYKDVYDFLQSKYDEYSKIGKIYYCEDRFIFDLVPFLDNKCVEKYKSKHNLDYLYRRAPSDIIEDTKDIIEDTKIPFYKSQLFRYTLLIVSISILIRLIKEI